jgi:hypothetical protein
MPGTLAGHPCRHTAERCLQSIECWHVAQMLVTRAQFDAQYVLRSVRFTDDKFRKISPLSPDDSLGIDDEVRLPICQPRRGPSGKSEGSLRAPPALPNRPVEQ